MHITLLGSSVHYLRYLHLIACLSGFASTYKPQFIRPILYYGNTELEVRVRRWRRPTSEFYSRRDLNLMFLQCKVDRMT